MKKYVFVALAAAILLAITGCNRNNTQEELLTAVTQYNTISALQPHTDTIYPPTHMLPYSADAAYDGLVDTAQVAPLLPPIQLDTIQSAPPPANTTKNELNECTINSHLFEAAKSLIIRYPGIFSFGYSRDSGELYSIDLSWEHGDNIWFDRNGNQIEQPSFVSNHGVMASAFAMYDINGESIMLIFHTPLNHGGGRAVMYRYVDGEYKEVVVSPYVTEGGIIRGLPMSSQFHTDNLGRIIMSYGSCYVMEYGYYEVDFNGNTMYIKPIIEFKWPYFYNSSSGVLIGSLDDYAEHRVNQDNIDVRTIFGIPDVKITPVTRLEELELEIISSLRSSAGLK